MESILFYTGLVLMLFGMGMLTISLWLRHSANITMDKNVSIFAKKFIIVSLIVFFMGFLTYFMSSL